MVSISSSTDGPSGGFFSSKRPREVQHLAQVLFGKLIDPPVEFAFQVVHAVRWVCYVAAM